MFDLAAVQSALREEGVDGWLLYDFRGLNVLARRVAQMAEGQMLTRRWFYLIPAQGEPRKLVHRIEAHHLDSLPGTKQEYSSWQELWENLKSMLAPCQTIAMQYSPNNLVPYIGLVDAGTIALVRSFGKNIASSGDLV